MNLDSRVSVRKHRLALMHLNSDGKWKIQLNCLVQLNPYRTRICMESYWLPWLFDKSIQRAAHSCFLFYNSIKAFYQFYSCSCFSVFCLKPNQRTDKVLIERKTPVFMNIFPHKGSGTWLEADRLTGALLCWVTSKRRKEQKQKSTQKDIHYSATRD